MKKNILVIEDRPSQLRLIESSFAYYLSYHNVNGIDDVNNFKNIPSPDVVLIDMAMAGHEYLNVIRSLRISKPQWPLIALIEYGNDEFAMKAVAFGANDYITKPSSLERIKLTIENAIKTQNMSEAIARLERIEMGYMNFSDIIGNSWAMKKAKEQAQLLSASSLPIWIDGEYGTGKELFARAIHGSSAKANEPFMAIECLNFTQDHIETTASGEEKTDDTLLLFIQKLHEARRGTIYLKNVTALPARLQECLLNALEHGTLPAVGEFFPVPVNFRIIASNSKKLKAITSDKEDDSLQKKLKCAVISMPALRERKEDIGELVKYFITVHAASENKAVHNLAHDALKLLENNTWPGNVIQLSRMIQRAVLLCNHGELDVGTLRLIQQLEPVNYSNGNNNVVTIAPTLVDYQGHIKKLKSIEEEVIRFALIHTGGSMTRAARELGIGRSTLYRKIGTKPPIGQMRAS